MKYTEAIEELGNLISKYEIDLDNRYKGYIGDSALEWRKKSIVNMACAIEVLKNNEG